MHNEDVHIHAPRPRLHGTTVHDHRVPANAVRVAAFGDSLMWGQGLRRDERFTAEIAKLIPMLQPYNGRQAAVTWDESRSGAKIRARGDDRHAFVDRFPALFADATARRRFLDGSDESPASN